MRASKKQLIFIPVALLIVMAFVSGCTQSKKSYQAKVTKILADTKTRLDKTPSVKAGKSNSDQKRMDKNELEILKKTRDQLKSVNPPNDFYTGHAELLQFLNLYIQGKELTIKEAAKGSSKKPIFPPNQSQSAQMMMVANRSLSRAAQEFPFMEYELLETFGRLANSGPRAVPQQIRPQTP